MLVCIPPVTCARRVCVLINFNTQLSLPFPSLPLPFPFPFPLPLSLGALVILSIGQPFHCRRSSLFPSLYFCVICMYLSVLVFVFSSFLGGSVRQEFVTHSPIKRRKTPVLLYCSSSSSLPLLVRSLYIFISDRSSLSLAHAPSRSSNPGVSLARSLSVSLSVCLPLSPLLIY